MLSKKHQKIIILIGPTASGKTDLSFSCLDHFHKAYQFRLINSDSLQIYKDLHILSARPSDNDIKNYDHRLFGYISSNKTFSVGDWLKAAHKEISNSFADNRIPFLVGGTGLYIDRLLNGLVNIPSIPETTQKETAYKLDQLGSDAFYNALCQLDPLCKNLDHIQNPQRLLRYWNVKIHTGRSLIEWQQDTTKKLPYPFLIIMLLPQRDVLYHNCNLRFEKMIEQGALFEAAHLLSISNNIQNKTLLKALAIPQLTAYLEGNTTLDCAIEKAQQLTRNYAKRQLTWFRNKTYPQFRDHIIAIENSLSDQERIFARIRDFLV